MTTTEPSVEPTRLAIDEARRAALRTALVLGAVAAAFFIAAFVVLPR